MNALFTCHSPNSVPQGLAVLAAAALLLGAGNMSVVMAENAYAGRYMGDGLVAEIKAGASGFTGTLKMGTQAFPLTASEVAGCLAGRFKSGEDEFKFEAVLQSDKLTLTTEGTTYTLVRKSIGSGASNPLAKPPPANPLARRAAESSDRGTGSKGPEVTQTSTPPEGEPGHGAAWKEFRHPTGFRMSYPPDWKLKELPAAVQLVPPDPASNADGPTEAYLVVAEAAEGVSAPSDPRVLAFLDGQMGKLVPFMRRSGSGTPVNAGSAPGVLVTWTGSNPKGMALQAHAFTTILKGYGVVLFAIGEKEQVAKRDKTLQGVFASFAAGEGEKDPQLVGAWKFWSYSSSSIGSYSTERFRLLVLRADGTCAWSSRTDTSASLSSKDSLGNQTWTAGVAGTGGNADKGTWSAGGGKLFVMWQDGSLSEWGYAITGEPGNRRLFLKGNKEKPDEWVEAR